MYSVYSVVWWGLHLYSILAPRKIRTESLRYMGTIRIELKHYKLSHEDIKILPKYILQR